MTSACPVLIFLIHITHLQKKASNTALIFLMAMTTSSHNIKPIFLKNPYLSWPPNKLITKKIKTT